MKVKKETILQKLTTKNFIDYCAHHYNNPACIDEKEFQTDIKCARTIRRLLLRKYRKDNFNENILINNFIILGNVFGVLPSLRIIFYSIEPEYHFLIIPYIKRLKWISDYNSMILRKYDDVNIKLIILEDKHDS